MRPNSCNTATAKGSINIKLLRQVVVSDSVLYDIKRVELNVSHHVDLLVVPKGKVQDLAQVFIDTYFPYRESLEVVLVCGLEDVASGQSVGNIMRYKSSIFIVTFS